MTSCEGLAVLPDELPQQLAASSHLRRGARDRRRSRRPGGAARPRCRRPRPRARAAAASSSANGARPASPALASPNASSAPPSPVRASTARAPASRWAVASASRSSSSLEPSILVGDHPGARRRARRLGSAGGRSPGPARARRHRASASSASSLGDPRRAASRKRSPDRPRRTCRGRERCSATPSNDWWLCCPCRSTRRLPSSASCPTVASRPLR